MSASSMRLLVAVVNDPERLDGMARNGRARAEENYDWRTLGRKLKEWLAPMCFL